VGKLLRNPRTTQEIKANALLECEIGEVATEYGSTTIKGRCRGIGVVPTNWDDIRRSDLAHRTWKRHRRFQYH
jgi:hypothetical protein